VNEHELKRLFPNASAGFLAANTRPAAVVERAAGQRTLAAVKAEKPDSGRFLVRVTSRRRRLLDEDNLAEKFHVDCCRYAGIIPGDAPECASIEVRQEKVGKGEQEETLIDIYEQPT